MSNSANRVVLSTHDFYHFVDISDILYCKSENSYTTFHLIDNKTITVSMSIKKVEEMMKTEEFVRSHQSFLINVNHIKSIHKTVDNQILLVNGDVIPISSRRKRSIIHFLSNLQRIQIP